MLENSFIIGVENSPFLAELIDFLSKNYNMSEKEIYNKIMDLGYAEGATNGYDAIFLGAKSLELMTKDLNKKDYKQTKPIETLSEISEKFLKEQKEKAIKEEKKKKEAMNEEKDMDL